MSRNHLLTTLVLLGLLVGAAGVARASLPTLGAPFPVNTTTRGSQAFPALDVGASGAAVIVWTCEDPDLSPGICARRFDSVGLPVGEELRVNSFTAGVQTDPDVAVDGEGNFVVVWESSGQDGDQTGVYARRFAANGSPRGDELRVNATTAGRQQNPAVASAADGRFVVVWDDSTGRDGSGNAIVLRRYGTGGSPSGGEAVVNTATQGTQTSPALAMSASGRFVVAWQTTAYPTGGGADIAARRYGTTGAALDDELLVNTFTTQGQTRAAVAIASDGSFVVAWESFTQDGSDQGIYAQRYSSGGATTGNERRVNATVEGIQIEAAVTITAGGVAVVSWSDLERDGIFARCLGPGGAPLAGEVLIESDRSGASAVGADLDGDVLFAIQDDGPEIVGRLGRVGEGCVATGEAECLNQARFEIEAAFVDFEGTPIAGQGERLTADTGYFWFIGPDNVEVVVKVLDACALNDRYWVFATGLTDVAVDLVVTDTATGEARLYRSGLGKPFALVRDTEAFDGCPGSSARTAARFEPRSPTGSNARVASELSRFGGQVLELVRSSGTARFASRAAGGCADTATALCLAGSRFRVAGSFRDQAGRSGAAMAEPITADTGYLWFFEEDNVEVVIKVLDACALNGRYWVFAAGLTDVRVALTVTDATTGLSREYVNPLGIPFALINDTQSFPCDA